MVSRHKKTIGLAALMKLEVARYLDQKEEWPSEGRHILAQYDDESIVVYQAYNPSIGTFAARYGYFGGGGFSFSRMSWIKPNFLWMMYRSGWGTKAGQEVTLAARLKRPFFDAWLDQAVVSSYDPELYSDAKTWKEAVASSCVRLQWDPDHDPAGRKVKRRALQLGLQGQALREYARNAIIEIIDISQFVALQRVHAESGDYSELLTPVEREYLPDCR